MKIFHTKQNKNCNKYMGQTTNSLLQIQSITKQHMQSNVTYAKNS